MHPSIPRPRQIAPEIEAVVVKHGHEPEQLLPILSELNAKRGSLGRSAREDVAHALSIPPKRVQGVATFYAMLSTVAQPANVVRVCDGVACWLRGAGACRAALERELAGRAEWGVTRSSCLGLCDRAPAALVDGEQCGPLTPENVAGVLQGELAGRMESPPVRPGETRFVLELAGTIDPESIDEALSHGVWSGLAGALRGAPEQIISSIESTGLRGRGGAGFPAARKWRTAADAPGGPRIVICNADESEPLAFKDRVLLESNPQAILEGMALVARAVGAEQGFLYIRGEYEAQARRIERAIAQARARGWLGARLAGTEFRFDVHVHRGAGAYICGEETALLESLEGKRGEPRIRPPYPAIAGYRGRPTVVHNVETLAAVSAIARRGVAAYRAIGNPAHPGARLYTVLGHVRSPGLFEAPLGLTVRQMIEEFGGGLAPGARFGCALVGGAAGTLITSDQLDTPLGFPGVPDSIPAGTGAVLVCDDSVSPVAVLREVLHFFESESCGKCTPCRIGTSEARRTVESILAGEAAPADLTRLQRLAATLRAASLCGLGVSVADPVLSALAHFGADFERLVRR